MRKEMFGLLGSVTIRAFENAGWKLDDNGSVVLKDGNPVWVNADGSEGTISVDAVSRANADAKAQRLRAEKAETALQAFEGLDAETARDAITRLETVDLSKMVDAGKVDEVKSQITLQYEAKLAERDKALNDVTGQYHSTLLKQQFTSSKFLQEKIAVPADMFMATFANNFKVEDGKVVAVGADGQPVYSKTRFGEVADFDEALGIIVDGYAHKDSILKAPSGGGTGNGGAAGQGGGSAKVVRRSDFEGKAPHEQAAIAAAAKKGEVRIVD